MDMAQSMPLPMKNTSLEDENFEANHWILSFSSKSLSIFLGRLSSSSIISFSLFSSTLFFATAKARAKAYIAASWAEYALVVATAISGPARVLMT